MTLRGGLHQGFGFVRGRRSACLIGAWLGGAAKIVDVLVHEVRVLLAAFDALLDVVVGRLLLDELLIEDPQQTRGVRALSAALIHRQPHQVGSQA